MALTITNESKNALSITNEERLRPILTEGGDELLTEDGRFLVLESSSATKITPESKNALSITNESKN